MKRKIQLLTMVSMLGLAACATPAFAEGPGPGPTIMLPGTKAPEGPGPGPTAPAPHPSTALTSFAAQ
jgi:hypothetical protein